jgi:biotin carboxyl carrier protein
MKWKSARDGEIWSVRLLHEGGQTLVSHLKCGEKILQSDVRITFDSKSATLSLDDGGKWFKPKATKVGDSWWVTISGQTFVMTEAQINTSSTLETQGGLTAPMPGIVRKVNTEVGQRVREGQPLMVLEAMKMEHQIIAPNAGRIEQILYQEGDKVDMGSVLISISD